MHDRARRAELEQALAGRGWRSSTLVHPVALVLVDADGPQPVRSVGAGWPMALVAAGVSVDGERGS